MAKKFINKSPKVDLRDIEDGEESCGTEEVKYEDIPGHKEVTKIAAERGEKLKELRNSRAAPYTEYTASELVYIPIVFHLFEDREKEAVYHNGMQFYIDVIDTINSMLEGTFVVPDEVTMGAAKYHTDHGVECKIRYKLPQQLPAGVLKNFNYPVSTNAMSVMDFGYHDHVVEASSSHLSLYGIFKYNDSSVLNTAQADALADFTVAEAAYNTLFNYTVSVGNSETEATNLLATSPEFIEYERTDHINQLGGFIDCGPTGAIFIRDVNDLKGSRMTAYGYQHGYSLAVNQYSEIYPPPASVDRGNSKDFVMPANNNGTKMEPSLGPSKYWTKYQRQLRIPAIHVFNYRGTGDERTRWANSMGFSGKSPFPTALDATAFAMQPHGIVEMYTLKDMVQYCHVLLHELGHSFTLSHTFTGGRTTDMFTDIYNVTSLPFTGDAAVLNTLSNDDKLFVEGRINLAADLVASDLPGNIFMHMDTVVEDGVTIKILPTADSLGFFNLYDSNTITYKSRILEYAMNTTVVWGGSLSETEFTSEGFPRLIINKASYGQVTYGISGDIYLDLLTPSSYSNTPINHGAYVEFTNATYALGGGVGFNIENAGIINSCVISFKVNANVVVKVHDQLFNVLYGSAILGDLYPDQIFTISFTAAELDGVTDIVIGRSTTSTASIYIHSIVVNTTAVVSNETLRAVDHVTRIPFCKLDSNGAITNIYDEFWALNGNWVNEDFPPYPDNMPTDFMYDATYCPCLHTPQLYRDADGVISSFTPISDSQGMRDMYNLMDDVVTDISSSNAKSSKSSVVNAMQMGVSYFFPLNATRGYVLPCPNGVLPIIGFCGMPPIGKVHALLGTPSTLYSGNTYIKEDPSTSRVSDTAPQMTAHAEFKVTYPIQQRFMTGNSNINSRYYNPYLLSNWSDSLSGLTTQADNVFYNKDLLGFNLNYTSIYECMQYRRTISSYLTSSLLDTDPTSGGFSRGSGQIGTCRVSFSPAQIAIAEAAVDLELGMYKRAKRFGDLIELGTYESTTDLFTPIYEDIVTLIADPSLDQYIVCNDTNGLNYDIASASSANGYIGDDRVCIYPVPICDKLPHIINVCLEDSPLICGFLLPPADFLEYFDGTNTESVVLYSEEYPGDPDCEEGDGGGGFKYVLDNNGCVYGTIDTDCFVGNTSEEELVELLTTNSSEYTLNCGESADTRDLIYPNLFTSGGMYFSSKGEYYSGPYVYRTGGIVWAGSIGNTSFRLYTSEQLSALNLKTTPTLVAAEKFFKVKESIENICKFVK